MWSRHKAALQESTRLFTRLAPGHLHHLPFLQGKAPSSWALTRRTDFDEFHWNKFRLHASNQKRKAVFRMFYLLFDDLHHTVLQSHHLFRPERSFDKAPYCKALVHFHFLQKKKNVAWKNLGKRWKNAISFLCSQESSQAVQLNQSLAAPSHCLSWGVILLSAPETWSTTHWAAARSKEIFQTAAFPFTMSLQLPPHQKERPQRYSSIQVSWALTTSLKNNQILLCACTYPLHWCKPVNS